MTMATLRRKPSSSSKDKDIVGRFNLHGRCKKHPKHSQAPGVCSLCLKDKLSLLSSLPAPSSSSSQRTANSDSNSSCSSSSSDSSSCVSSCASPHRSMRHPSSVSIFLVKSKSMAVFPTTRRLRDIDEGVVDKKRDKKNGFWFKLLHPKAYKSKRMEEKKDIKMVRASSLREALTLRS